MITVLILAQGESTPAPDIFEVTTNSGDVYYGTVQEIPNGIVVVEDAPWKNNPKHSIPESRLKGEPLLEGKTKRAERIAREAKKDGWVESNGMWVPIREADLAARAESMIADVRAKSGEPVENDTTVTPTTVPADVAPTEPSWLAQWGLHTAIVVVTAVLLALVLRLAILR